MFYPPGVPLLAPGAAVTHTFAITALGTVNGQAVASNGVIVTVIGGQSAPPAGERNTRPRD